MESHRRSILKAITWRILATLVTTVVVYWFTKEVTLSLGIGVIDAVIKMLIYYGHERFWDKVGFGRQKETADDYTI